VYHLMSYYPAVFPAAENDYRIPVGHETGEPDLQRAALSRAAELSMVAFDTNAPESQFLQGWLMNDAFVMRGTFGVPYEFLWANPYQPGLSYYHVPLVLHDKLNGRLFVRSSWDDSAAWLGFFDGEVQLFRDGKVATLDAQTAPGPLPLEEALVLFSNSAGKFRAAVQEDEQVFVLGLKPLHKYDIEVEGEELREGETDIGGILELELPPNTEVAVRMKETAAEFNRPTAITPPPTYIPRRPQRKAPDRPF
jgi:hypothetical protein